jgi:hypothetical protein
VPIEMNRAAIGLVACTHVRAFLGEYEFVFGLVSVPGLILVV